MKRALWVLAWATASMVAGYHLVRGGHQKVVYTVDKFREVMSIVLANYVDSVDEAREVEQAVRAMLEDLDPHSRYIPASEVEQTEEPLTGSFEGIGIEFNIVEDTIVVVSAIPGGPSEEVGLRAGDKIIRIDGESAVGFTTTQVMKTLRGPKGTRVVVTVRRAGVDDSLTFVITRDKIPLRSVDAAYLIQDTIGYVKISRFAAPTPNEFAMRIRELRQRGMRRLIIDLRGNPGGYLQSAVLIADELLPDETLITYMEGRARPRQDYVATSYGYVEDVPAVVLIDQGTASASEILAGALQDWDRAVIIGRRSYGKGLVQESFHLRDGSLILLTVARYHTPSGRVIQRPYNRGKQGIHDYEMDWLRRWEQGELFVEDSIKVPDSLRYTTAGGRVVYGGGGIVPDVFVPLDTSSVSTYANRLIRHGIMSTAILKYASRHRERLKFRYSSVEEFAREYEVPDELMARLIEAAEEAGIGPPSADERREFYRYGRRSVKALLARHLFGSSGYFQILNLHDSDVERAIAVLTSDEYDKILNPNHP